MIRIQTQDRNGNWRDRCTCSPSSVIIRHRMDDELRKNPGHRVRAIDSQGRVVDIL